MSAATATPLVTAVARAIGGRLDRSPLLVLLDVDGTLAPIAPTPSDARVPDETRQVLGRLSRAPGVTVALVSGRAAEDAWALVGVPGVWAIGNHGLERRDPHGRITADERIRMFEAAIATASRRLEEDLRDVAGAIVENKRWTLSVHYRLVSDTEVTRLIGRAEAVARYLGLRALAGKKIVELRPPVDVHKGTACLAFAMEQGVSRAAGSAFYAGDDRTDEDAFRELREALPDAVTVRIAAPDERDAVASEAELLLESPGELRLLLEWLATRRASAPGGER